jgi:hypothetical protein
VHRLLAFMLLHAAQGFAGYPNDFAVRIQTTQINRCKWQPYSLLMNLQRELVFHPIRNFRKRGFVSIKPFLNGFWRHPLILTAYRRKRKFLGFGTKP